MRSFWIPGINNLKKYGRRAFAEFTEPYSMDEDLAHHIHQALASAMYD